MKYVDELDLKNKTIFLRADLNVPLDSSGQISDDSRIKASLPTIQFIRQHGGKLVLASHLGRPKGKQNADLSLKPIAKRLKELTGANVTLAPSAAGEDVNKLKSELQEEDILLLENLRFHPGETKNDPEFSKELSKGIDCFVNDAFGTAHRAHASTVGIANLAPEKAAGFTLRNEIEYFSKCFDSPKRPLVAIFGGSKVSSKIGAINNVAKIANSILIGGAMANTFFAAEGEDIGKSLYEPDFLGTAKETKKALKELGCELHLPSDLLLTKEITESASVRVSSSSDIKEDEMAVDIGPKTLAEYSKVISQAKTVVWNGPMGVLEIDTFASGTYGIVDALCQSDALTVVGGGDTDLALHKKDAFQKVSYVSTGGGAFLVLLEGNKLYAVEALEG